MKKSIIGLCLLIGVQICSAQNKEVSGKVVDKLGEPVQGARVSVKGSSANVVTDVDGKFKIAMPENAVKLEAKYIGLNTKTQTAKDGMVFKLNDTKSHWFVSAQALTPVSGFDCFVPGVMAGWVSDFGIYAKGFRSEQKDYVYTKENKLTGKDSEGYWGFTGGLMARIKDDIYGYAGLGYLNRKIALETTEGWADVCSPDDFFVPEIGAMMFWNHLAVNVGFIYHKPAEHWYLDKAPDYKENFFECLLLNVGVGYSF